ncbi:hypothetical protein [Trichocoleus sp. FACHB-262]|nr:hypothetical protein [Trichocoleus sp. FACHB-262]MBD2122748.1 hypothetical protein [Trichocoleus sp. FACHB-262]
MKGEEGVRSQKLGDRSSPTKDTEVTFGGGLGDATVPQRGFGGKRPQGFS